MLIFKGFFYYTALATVVGQPNNPCIRNTCMQEVYNMFHQNFPFLKSLQELSFSKKLRYKCKSFKSSSEKVPSNFDHFNPNFKSPVLLSLLKHYFKFLWIYSY